jgi:release factor glutamine methyltransferase
VTATTVGILRRRIAAAIEEAFRLDGREGTAALDARLLVAHGLGLEAGRLALHDDEGVDAPSEARVMGFVERRIAGEPVARIIGRREFWGLDIEIGPETLIPRPDTETLVEAALAFVDGQSGRGEALSVLDIGTGSGAILLALLSELPAARGIATDRSESALAIARRNAQMHGVAGRAVFVLCDWASALEGPFDLILANPPYIESAAIAGLEIEVRDHDPRLALDGGSDGLDAFRAILADLPRILAPEGRAFLEMGASQGPSLARLAGEYGYEAKCRRDLAGRERVTELKRLTLV